MTKPITWNGIDITKMDVTYLANAIAWAKRENPDEWRIPYMEKELAKRGVKPKTRPAAAESHRILDESMKWSEACLALEEALLGLKARVDDLEKRW